MTHRFNRLYSSTRSDGGERGGAKDEPEHFMADCSSVTQPIDIPHPLNGSMTDAKIRAQDVALRRYRCARRLGLSHPSS
jgi:hypothetical protein